MIRRVGRKEKNDGDRRRGKEEKEGGEDGREYGR